MGSSILISLRERHNISRISILIMNKLFVAVVLFGAVYGDGGSHAHAPAASSGYAAPQDAYASPASEYAAPQYSAPAASYDAPSYEQTYDAPAYEPATGYEVSAPSYQAADPGLDFDLSKITELLPLFIAVFAAIIVAQLVAPIFSMLFGAKVNFLGGILSPLGQAKVDLINVFLQPFDLTIADCTPTGSNPCTNRAVNVGSGRSFGDYDVLEMIDMAQRAYESLTN